MTRTVALILTFVAVVVAALAAADPFGAPTWVQAVAAALAAGFAAVGIPAVLPPSRRRDYP